MNNIPNDFPFLRQTVHGKKIAYFDNAATAQKPHIVLDALSHFYTNNNANVHRGIYTHAETATEQFESARNTVAQFIGADPTEIVFTRGTTDSINLVAHAWAMQHITQSDRIVVTALEHHANLLPWYYVSERTGAQLVIIPVEPDGTISPTKAASYITSNCKLVSFVHTSHVTGAQLPVAQLVALAHLVGAHVMLDASQSVAHQTLDVQALGVDFLAFSAHKMGGPTGIGILFAATKTHKDIRPHQWGGGMVDQILPNNSIKVRPMPHCLEAGTPAIAQAVGLAAAIGYISGLDREKIKRHQSSLCAHLIDALTTLPRITLIGPQKELKQRGHLVSFWVDGIHAHDVAYYLDHFAIAVRAGNLCAQPAIEALGGKPLVRASFLWYNTHEEIERLIHSLKEIAL